MSKAAVNKQVNNAKEILAEVKSYSRNLYLAGLGVYGTTEQQRSKSFNEVKKTSTSIFKELVKAGEGLEKKGKKLVDDQVKNVNTQITTVKSTVTEQIEKLKTAANGAKKPAAKAPAKAAAKPAAKAPVKAAAKPAAKKPAAKKPATAATAVKAVKAAAAETVAAVEAAVKA